MVLELEGLLGVRVLRVGLRCVRVRVRDGRHHRGRTNMKSARVLALALADLAGLAEMDALVLRVRQNASQPVRGALLDPGAYLPTPPPQDLTIDFTSDMHYRVGGSVSGRPADNAILTTDDVTVTGTAQFAVSKWDRDLGTLTGATLNSYAFKVTGGIIVGPTATPTVELTFSGSLAVATVNDSADAKVYTAIKVTDANVTAAAGDFGLHGQLEIDYYDSNSVAAATGYERLDWNTVFADGELFDPGAALPTPKVLPIDFTSDMHY